MSHRYISRLLNGLNSHINKEEHTEKVLYRYNAQKKVLFVLRAFIN